MTILAAIGRRLGLINGDLPPPSVPPIGGEPFRSPNQPPGLEVGAARRRLALWQPAAAHVNTLMRQAGPTVNARARWLVRNNGYAKAALSSWAASTVGAGIVPNSLVDDPDLKEALHKAWYTWTDEADAEENTDFYGITRRVSREAFLAGECFVRLRPRFPQDGLSVPLQLQILPSEQLPLWKQEVVPPEGVNGSGYNAGGSIRMGIEFDRNLRDKRVAYWFFRADPGDGTVSFSDALRRDQLVRVPAAEILHVYDPVEAGQLRGLTRYHAAAVKLFQMDAYDDAELERKNQIARHAIFITVPQEFDDQGNPLIPDPGDDPLVLAPGVIARLLPGEDVKNSQPGDVGGSYEPFQFRTLTQISQALGVPYAELTGDLTKATYANSRAGLVAYRQEVEAFQYAVLVFQFVRRVWIAWLDAAVLAGAVPISAQAYNANPARWRAMQGIPPRAPWVDPLKDRQAITVGLRNQTISPLSAAAAEGQDYETVIRECAEAAAIRAKYGVPDPDLGWGARTGGAPAAPPPSGEDQAA